MLKLGHLEVKFGLIPSLMKPSNESFLSFRIVLPVMAKSMNAL